MRQHICHLIGVAIAATLILLVVGCHVNDDDTRDSLTTANVSQGLPYFVAYPRKYDFIVDEPRTCQQQEPLVVVIVPVNPSDRASRDHIRRMWGRDTQSPVLGQRVSLFFLLGLPTGEGAVQVEEEVLKESRDHRDMLQSDFFDAYVNLTIKTMVMMEWLESRCPMASFAMKIDTDMFLNVHNLVDMLSSAPKEGYMTGLVAHRGEVIRDEDSKWFLPHDAFPESHFPPYARGPGYIFSLDLPRKLLEASRHVDAVYLEDVYLGLCMKHLGIPLTDLPSSNVFYDWPMTRNTASFNGTVSTCNHL